MNLTTTIRSHFHFAGDLARAAEVARVLTKYGLAAWFKGVEWEALHHALRSQNGEELLGQSFETRVRLALTDLGPTFIKLGQMLSTREHLIGLPLASELSKLQESTPADPGEVAIEVVERELGRPIGECFARFEKAALASASIGQVHRVTLKSGESAVVKVQHPDIEGTVRRDLEILAFLAEMAEKNDRLRSYQPVALVREFSRTMLKELDFRREMRNLQIFRRNFANDATVVFPKPYSELTSGRVLTMEYIAGVHITDTKGLEKAGAAREEVARHGAEIFLQMIFRDGFYHADPHPGNFLVLAEGKLALLDVGMVGRLDETMHRQLEDILLGIGEHDAEALTDTIMRLCKAGRHVDREDLSAALTDFVEDFGSQNVSDVSMSEALTRITGILHEHRLNLPGPLSMLLKCLVILEGTGRMLNPSFNLAELLRPWRRRIVVRRLSPRAQYRHLVRLYRRWERMTETVPRALVNTVERLEKGEFAVRLEHRHLRSAANRLVVGLFASSLLIASAILLALHVPPLAWGLSIVGMIGYVAAVVIGVNMLWVNRDKLIARRDHDWD